MPRGEKLTGLPQQNARVTQLLATMKANRIERLPEKTVQINKTSIRVLLDCGAQTNVIKREVAEKLDVPLTCAAKPVEIQGATDKDTAEVANLETTVTFEILGQSITEPFLVSQACQSELILGMPFIMDHFPLALKWLEESTHNRQVSKQSNTTTSQYAPEGTPPPETSKLWTIRTREVIRDLKKPQSLDQCWLLLVRTVPHATAETPIGGPEEDPDIQAIKREFADVIVSELPEHSKYNGHITHRIDLIPGKPPPHSRPYRMSEEDSQELEKQIDGLLKNEQIFPTTSPYGAPVLFVKKKDGSKRLCVDFRKLNEQTVKSRFPLPLIEDLFDYLKGAKWFTSLDLIAGYHQIPVRFKDRAKTAFVTSRGQYAWNVMPFGLTNAPSTFQMIMNETLREFLHKSALVYLDDILVYSRTKEEHLRHVREILMKFREVNFKAKESKCTFFSQELKFLGHVVNAEGIHMDDEKVSAVQNWPTPKNVKETRQFLGLAGYYRRFVKDFSKIARPLHQYVAKNSTWGEEQTAAFERIKSCLIANPVIIPFDGSKTVRVTTDASYFAIGATLELLSEDGKVSGVVAFYSKTLVNEQLKWATRTKEFFAVKSAVLHWRHYLLGRQFELCTDHKSLQTVLNSTDGEDKILRWITHLQQFTFTIRYIPGESNHADGLSRIQINALSITEATFPLASGPQLVRAYERDKRCQNIIRMLRGDQVVPKSWKSQLKRYLLDGDWLYYRNQEGEVPRLYVPSGMMQHDLLEFHHSAPGAGHTGIDKTYAKLAEYYYWPHMVRSVQKFVQTCDPCQRSKSSTKQPEGFLHPLDIPSRRFEAINIDFVSGFPLKDGYNEIMVVTDRFSKYGMAFPVSKTSTTHEIAKILLVNVVLPYGVPRYIVSDRDKLFTTTIWSYFTQRLGIHLKFTTAYNPQADGQVERLNKTLVETMRATLQNSTDWPEALPFVMFAYNTAPQSSTHISPFVALRGFRPRYTGMFNAMWDAQKYNRQGSTTSSGITLAALEQFMSGMHDQVVRWRDQIAEAQDRQSANYNEKRREPTKYKVGDKILVNAKEYITVKRDSKFAYKWFGPLTISRIIGDTNIEVERGELSTAKKHNVFNLRAVKPYYPTAIEFQEVPEATLEALKRAPQQIERIMDISRDGQTYTIATDQASEVDFMKIPKSELVQLMSPSRFERLKYSYEVNKSKRNQALLRW